MYFRFTSKTIGFTRKTFGFTRKTIGFPRKTLDFTHETFDFTHKTVIYDTNGLPYTLGGKFVNHMIYADDLCIVFLPSSGLQTWLYILIIVIFAISSLTPKHLFFKSSVNKRCALPKNFNRDTICEFSNEVMISSSMRTTTDAKRQTRVCTSQLVNS